MSLLLALVITLKAKGCFKKIKQPFVFNVSFFIKD